MKTTTELLQQLNTMQSEHIKLLEQRIEVINEHKQHLNKTISNQAKQIEELFRIARIDNEVISDFKKIINQQDKQIKDLKIDVDYFINNDKEQ